MDSLRPVVCALMFCSCVLAQRLVWRIDGIAAGDQLGRSVAGAGDVNGDGYDDVIVGAWRGDLSGADSGYARVISGRTGAVLYHFNGDSAGDEFGRSVARAGDVDGDGYGDLLVGAPGDDDRGTDSGSVRIFSGRTGAVIRNLLPPQTAPGDRFGYGIGGAGDVDGDGYDDVVVGAPYNDAIGADAGAAYVYRGRDGTLLWTWRGEFAGDEFGHSASIIGDWDGDGFAETVVGAPRYDSDSGSTYLYRGRVGTRWTVRRGVSAQLFGWSVGGAGDLTGDLRDDHVVGAPHTDNFPSHVGSATVFGSDGSQFRIDGRSLGGAFFGCSVDGAGDVDGDGYDDVIVGAYGDPTAAAAAGSAHVMSGRLHTVLHIFDGSAANDWLGFDVGGAGDIDGDGFTELIVGIPFDDHGATDAGAAHVYDLDRAGSPARARPFGAACRGFNGYLPHVESAGRPFLGRNLVLRLRGARMSTPVALNLGVPTEVDLGSHGLPGCTLLATVDAISMLTTTSVYGTASSSAITVPNVPALVGSVLAAQWVCADAAANPVGVSLSNGLRLTLGT